MRFPALTSGLFSTALFFAAQGQPLSVNTVQNVQKYALGDLHITATTSTTEETTQAAVQPEAQPEPAPAESATRPEVYAEVVKGDSLSKIAKAHNTTFQRLFDANAFISDPNIINPGDKIRIPYEDEQIASRPLPAAPPKTEVTKATKPAAQKKQTVRASNAPAVADGSVWDRLAACESGGNWAINTGNGYYGGLQFSAATWRAVGGSGLPHQNSREEQILRAEILLARSGWGQWPACTLKLGLR